MADNNNQNKSSADIKLHAEVTVTQTYKRTHVRNQTTNRDYPILRRTKEIINRNYNGFKTYINRNYRRFSY